MTNKLSTLALVGFVVLFSGATAADNCEHIRKEIDDHKRNLVKVFKLKKQLKECERSARIAVPAAPATAPATEPSVRILPAPASTNLPQRLDATSPAPNTPPLNNATQTQTSPSSVGLYVPIPSAKAPANPVADAVSVCEPQVQAVVNAYRNAPQKLYPDTNGVTRERLIKDMLSQSPSREDYGRIWEAIRDHERKISESRDAGYREQMGRPLSYLKLRFCVIEQAISIVGHHESERVRLIPSMAAACDENVRRKEADLKTQRLSADDSARQLGQYIKALFGNGSFSPRGPCGDHPKQLEMMSRAHMMIQWGGSWQSVQPGSNGLEQPRETQPSVPPPKKIGTGGTGCGGERMRGISCDGWVPESRGQQMERERREQLAREQQRQREEAQRRARAEELARQQREAAERARRAQGGGYTAPAPAPAARPDMYGALAIDYAQGRAYGWAVNGRTQAEAEQAALSYCNGGNSGRCQVVMRFHNTCASYAIDNAPGSTALGWAWGPNQANVDATALNYCRQRGGPSNQCFTRVWGCTSR